MPCCSVGNCAFRHSRASVKAVSIQAVIVRVASGSVLPLGLGALLRAIREAECAHGSTAHSRPQGIDLWNIDIAKPRTFAYLTRSLRDGGLNRLRLIRLCDSGLLDEHICQLSCAIGRHPSLEILSVTSNAFTAATGIVLFDKFVSLPSARALDLSCNPLGDAMVQGIVGRLSSGTPWNLQALWFAYCSLTRAGLKEVSRIVRAGANNLEHLVLSGQKDNNDEWKTLLEACLDNAVKLRVLPDLLDTGQMSLHIMDEMTQAVVNRKCKSDSLAAAFMSYFHQFIKRKEECSGIIHGSTETSMLDSAWQDAMQIMDTIRHQ